MKAVITGASSGIGADMARVLSKMGYDLIITARREDRLLKLAKELPTAVTVIPVDLSITKNCLDFYDKIKGEDFDLAINNAGFGLFGDFSESDLETELDMIDLNISAVHILTKKFLEYFEEKGKGGILNVASSAGLMPGGPLMASYYATKAYVVSLTRGIYEELRKRQSSVKISVLCPGPVNTEFNSVAGVSFALKGLDSYKTAEYAIKKALKNKTVIIPGLSIKLAYILNRLVPCKIALRIAYNIQKKKNGKE